MKIQENAKGTAQFPLLFLGYMELILSVRRFGFVDFGSVEASTRALVNLKNFSHMGRQLTIEYASADAVRRGGGARPTTSKSNQPSRAPRSTPPSTATSNPRPQKPSRAPPPTAPTPALPASEPVTDASSVALSGFKKKQFLGRVTPGAALANAKRAPIGIIKNPDKVGKKIVFD